MTLRVYDLGLRGLGFGGLEFRGLGFRVFGPVWAVLLGVVLVDISCVLHSH